ncbi:MAG: hypothetical protein JW768_10265 [Chitinispirillaceae bacterium]|nr:hypothetical protein [Chitinispirillaceae bacterium]
MMRGYLIWCAPLIIILLAFLFHRFLPFRRVRYCFYAIVLITAFVLNLCRVSFWYDLADMYWYFAVNFILVELLWNVLRIRKRKLVLSLCVIALCGFCALHWRWVIAGPENAPKLWDRRTLDTFRHETMGDYAIKEQQLFYTRYPCRLLHLSKRLGAWPLEKHISSYRTPEGFSRTPFKFRWSETGQGVRLDLRTAGYTLWTMGEGF